VPLNFGRFLVLVFFFCKHFFFFFFLFGGSPTARVLFPRAVPFARQLKALTSLLAPPVALPFRYFPPTSLLVLLLLRLYLSSPSFGCFRRWRPVVEVLWPHHCLRFACLVRPPVFVPRSRSLCFSTRLCGLSFGRPLRMLSLFFDGVLL